MSMPIRRTGIVLRFLKASLALVSASAVLSSCNERKLGVYSLCVYEGSWKESICVDPEYDPYYDFWETMTGESTWPYADADDSRRYRNSEVNMLTALPIPGDNLKGWDEFDLVFFYGHNNMIVPPHPHDLFGYYTYDGTTWTEHWDYLDDIDWGHTTPYCYYSDPLCVTSGDKYPGSVTYLYYKYTSCLLGGVYHYGQGTGHNWRLHWNDPVQTTMYQQLGSKDLEWLILHGCQAVITANLDGSYNSMGLQCFHWVQGSFHIILGHYHTFGTNQLDEDLSQFARDLLRMVPIQEAYFDIDPDENTSAIAAEANPFPGWANSAMATDQWTLSSPDHKDASIFTQRWITQEGTIGVHWD
jgi:hypothetical protein